MGNGIPSLNSLLLSITQVLCKASGGEMGTRPRALLSTGWIDQQELAQSPCF